MLKKLAVEQFVIIDKLDLDFASGLTIFTGETGAGKSIILGAMGLVLGEPPTPKSIRAGAEQSIFEATFAPEKDHPVWKLLIENELATESDTDFTIHRVMKKAPVAEPDSLDASNTEDEKKEKEKKRKEAESENDDITLNGKVITRKILLQIGGLLVEIHGQFANQNLLGPKNQLNLLDLSGSFPQEVFDNVAEALGKVIGYKNELKAEKLFLARHKGLKLKKIEGLVKRFEDVGMKVGFIEETTQEFARLRRAKETMEAFQSILGRLIATNGSVLSLAGAKKTLEAQQNIDKEKTKKLAGFLDVALANSRDAVEEMGLLLPQYEIDTDPLEKLNKILNVLKKIAQEEKLEFAELTEFYVDQSTKLKRVRNGRDRLIELDKLLIDAKNDYKHHAHILTEKRIVAGEALGKAITAEFAPLKLEKAEFRVKVEERPESPWTKLGFNEVTFIARMNPGMPLSPIAETASGGELARMILALKVVLQKVQITPTLVFDEVDTGIGGAAAAAVGDRIALLSGGTQVLVITHSPQVASRGAQHLHISKRTEGETTISSVHELKMDDRIGEISRMLAGDKVTEESNAAAKSLIDEAEKARQVRQAG